MLRLRTVLGDYPHTAALKTGAVQADRVALELVPYSPTYAAFKPMVRELAFDVCEMAIVTYLIARAHGKKLVLLPAVMLGRYQHPYAIYNAERGTLAPADLAGRRVGIRSFTTTTGAWIRGILANDYGVDLGRIEWVTFEDPHVAEYRDTTQRAPAGKKIVDMLLAGELDAVLGDRSNDPRIKSLFAAPESEAKAWCRKHDVTPINHLVVVKETLAQADPAAVEDIYRMLRASKEAVTPRPDAQDPVPFGVEANRNALALIIEYAAQQQLIPRRFTVDELFDDTTRRMN
jgi:4,5-dihydroxyphthalate decarboxylase